MSDEIRQVRNRYSSRALIVAIALALIFIALGEKSIAKGLILGTLFSILNFVAMAYMLPARLGKSERRTFWAGMGGIWIRFALMGVPIFLALEMPELNFIATAAGLFMVQGVILAHHVGRLIINSRIDRRKH